MVYISTDYVFAGAPGDAPYAATAATGPTNLYGVTKLEGERAVAEAYREAKGGSGVVLRVPVLYGKAERAGESAVNVLVDAVWRAQAEEVRMDHWAKRFPTNTEDVGRVVAGRNCSFRCREEEAIVTDVIVQISRISTPKRWPRARKPRSTACPRYCSSPQRTCTRSTRSASCLLRFWG